MHRYWKIFVDWLFKSKKKQAMFTDEELHRYANQIRHIQSELKNKYKEVDNPEVTGMYFALGVSLDQSLKFLQAIKNAQHGEPINENDISNFDNFNPI